MIIGSEYHFSASHYLSCVPEGHQCRRLHGHNYRVVIRLEGDLKIGQAMLMDFADLDTIVDPMIARLDHHHLNDVLPFEPTAELIADYLVDEVRRYTREVYSIYVTIYETPTKFAEAKRLRAEPL